MSPQSISRQSLKRLPLYLNYLKSLPDADTGNISATLVAEALQLNDVQVRKDLAFVSSAGKPKIGYVTSQLIKDLEIFLGYNDTSDAVLVGAGRLGRALLNYKGFADYGLNILAAFDVDESLAEFEGKKIFHLSKLKDLCIRMNVRIGIITVPAHNAQEVCDILVDGGVLAIWNFAPTHLMAPPQVLIQNENMASSLALLSNHLKEKFK